MENLKASTNLPNTKECANTATGILRDLIRKHNLVVDRLIKAEQKISELQQNRNNHDITGGETVPN